MAEDSIVQEVILKGQDDIKAGFASIERAGLQMFETLHAAAGASPLQKFAVGISGTIAAITAITAGMFKWAESSAVATAEMSRLAAATGTTIEEFSTLAGALHIDPDKFATELKRMAVRVNAEWQNIQKAQREAANLIIADTLGIQNAYLGLERATVQLANVEQATAAQQVSNALQVKNAKIGLLEAIERQRIAEGGAVDPAFNDRIAKEKAMLAVKQARIALSEAQRKADEDAELASNKLAQSANDAALAQLKLSQAQEQAAENSRNSITNLAKFVDNLSKGVSNANVQVNASAENVIKGLIASVGPGIDALQNLKGTFDSVATAPPALKDVMLKLADVFKNTDNEVLKLAVSTALFGRGVGQKMVADLSKGSDALLKEQARLKALGLEITTTEGLISVRMEKAVETLGNTLTVLSRKFSLAFAPSFTALIKEINSAIEGSSQSFTNFGKTIDQKVTPVVVAFFETLTGADLRKNLELTPEQVVDIDRWKSTFGLLKEIVSGAFAAIGIIAVGTATIINKLFGREVTSGLEVGIAALIVRFGGFYGILLLVAVAIERITGGFVSRAISGIVDLLALVGKGLSAIYDRLSGKITTPELINILDEIDKKAKEVAKSVFDGTKKTGDDAVANMEKAERDVLASVTGMQTKVAAELNKGLPPANNIAASVDKIGIAADGSRKKVKDLASEIALLDANKGFNQKSAGGDIKVVDIRKDEIKGAGGDASKSFGEIPKMVKNVEELDQALGKLDVPAELFASFEKLAADFEGLSTGDVSDQAREFETQWSNATNNVMTDVEELSAALAEKLKPKVDLSEFGEIAELEDPLVQAFRNISDAVESAFARGGAGAAAFVEKLAAFPDQVQKGKESMLASFQSIPSEIVALFTGPFDELPGRLGTAISGKIDQVVAPFREASTSIIAALKPVEDFITGLFNKLAGLKLPGVLAENSGGGFAEGGLFRGRGGRDNNVVRVSDMEYFIGPRATRGWGLGFLEMVRTMDLPGVARWIGAATGQLRGFDAGGFVNSLASSLSPQMPSRMVTANVAGGGDRFAGHVTVDLRTNAGVVPVIATVDVARQLSQMSAMEQYASAGPAPGWVGRRGR